MLSIPMSKIHRYLLREQDYVILIFWLLILYLIYLQSHETSPGISKVLKHFLAFQ